MNVFVIAAEVRLDQWRIAVSAAKSDNEQGGSNVALTRPQYMAGKFKLLFSNRAAVDALRAISNAVDVHMLPLFKIGVDRLQTTKDRVRFPGLQPVRRNRSQTAPERDDCSCCTFASLDQAVIAEPHVLCGYFEEVVCNVFSGSALVDEHTENDVGINVVLVPCLRKIGYADGIPGVKQHLANFGARFLDTNRLVFNSHDTPFLSA